MASKRSAGTRVETIHCEFCGEDYAATYKRCPFCEERPTPEQTGDAAPKGGRRRYSNTRGGGYGGGPPLMRVIGTVVSLGIILAAVIIVVTFFMPLINKGKTPMVDVNASPAPGTESAAPRPTGSADPNAPLTPPADQTATGIASLSATDVSLYTYGQFFVLRAILAPADSVGTVRYVSANPAVAQVDADGKVTGLSRGTTTVKVTLPGAPEQTCIVRCQFDAPAGAVPPAGSTPGGGGAASTDPGNLKLNKDDFTLGRPGEIVQMKLTGSTSTPVWSIDKPAVATVSASGAVTAVAHGRATLTCTVDGKTLTCIVRCGF